MQVNPYLNFNGNCKEAFTLYQQVLGGTIEAMFTHGGTPAAEHVPPDWHDKIMHASLRLDNATLMGSDSPPGMYDAPKGIFVSLNIGDVAQGERVFNALSESGSVIMPFEETFWAHRFGMCVDRFGIPWMVNCEKPKAEV